MGESCQKNKCRLVIMDRGRMKMYNICVNTAFLRISLGSIYDFRRAMPTFLSKVNRRQILVARN
jgi:hypothetical protein